jgi:hypothetical protein
MKRVTEHAQVYAGGYMMVRPSGPEVEQIYPVETWLVDKRREGGTIKRRVILVVTDWEEV